MSVMLVLFLATKKNYPIMVLRTRHLYFLNKYKFKKNTLEIKYSLYFAHNSSSFSSYAVRLALKTHTFRAKGFFFPIVSEKLLKGISVPKALLMFTFCIHVFFFVLFIFATEHDFWCYEKKK